MPNNLGVAIEKKITDTTKYMDDNMSHHQGPLVFTIYVTRRIVCRLDNYGMRFDCFCSLTCLFTLFKTLFYFSIWLVVSLMTIAETCEDN